MPRDVVLGISTSGPVAAAVIAGDVEHSADSPLQALDGTLSCVIAALRSAGVGIDAVGKIAVCVGPGSFTGLRIGVALAKSLAQARDLPIVGVSSYDIADIGAPTDGFPRAAIVQGKRAYYYARIRRGPAMEPEYVRGSRPEIEAVAGSALCLWLPEVPAAEQALRVARIGRDEAPPSSGWRAVTIDYGQRPNAELNWESRHGIRERGGAPTAANHKQE